MGHVTIITPLSGTFVVSWLKLVMISLHAKFEVSTFTHYYEDMKSSHFDTVPACDRQKNRETYDDGITR